jgi:hypothetical protein
MKFRNERRGIGALGFTPVALAIALVLLFLPSGQGVRANPSDPVFQALLGMHKGLVFVGTVAYSSANGVSPQHDLVEHAPERYHGFDRASVFILPLRKDSGESVTKLTYQEIVEQLGKYGVTAKLAHEPADGMLGGPFYVIEFSYDGRHGRVFNAPNIKIAMDQDLSKKWYPEDLAVLYEK